MVYAIKFDFVLIYHLQVKLKGLIIIIMIIIIIIIIIIR